MKNIQELQEFLKDIFSDVILFIESHKIDVVARIGFSENSAYALRAYLSFALQPGDELVVLSIDCKYHENGLILESDIATTNGEIIAEGPTIQIKNYNQDEFNTHSSLWVEQFVRFIDKSRETLLENIKISTL